MTNPKIGKSTPEGVVYPSETITGKPYARAELDPAPTIVHEFADGYFAVGDMFPPAGFDVDAALAALRAEVAPAPPPVSVRSQASMPARSFKQPNAPSSWSNDDDDATESDDDSESQYRVDGGHSGVDPFKGLSKRQRRELKRQMREQQRQQR